MRQKFIILLIIISLFGIIVFEKIGSTLPAESPKTPSPTSDQPKPDPSCSGTAELVITESDSVSGGKIDTTDKKLMEKIKNLVMKLYQKLILDQNYQAFQACTYPSTFKCDKTKCDVRFSKSSIIGLSHSESATTDSQVKEGEGKIEVEEGFIDAALIGKQPQFDPKDPAGSAEKIKKWMGDVLNLVMPQLMAELQKVIEEIKKNNLCPPGSTAKIIIIPDFANKKIEKKMGWTGPYVLITVPYKYKVICQQVKTTTTTYINTELRYKKECIPKISNSPKPTDSTAK